MIELKESDLRELERLAKGGYKWIAKDWNEQVYAYTAKPFKDTTTWVGGVKCEKIIGLGINSQIGVHWSDPEPLNIADAIAQIKAQVEAAQTPTTPPTWNDAINAMSAEEKAQWLIDFSFLSCESWCPAYDPAGKYLGSSCGNECVKHLTEYLNSPYDGGKAQEGGCGVSEIKIVGIRSAEYTRGEKIVFAFQTETNDEGNGATFSDDSGMFIHTDFTPKILVDGQEIGFDRLRELCAAEREGRIKILPFKDKQVVFVISEGAVFECEAEYSGNECIAVSRKAYYVSAVDEFCPYVADIVTEADKGVTAFETRKAAEAALSAGKGE